MKTLNTVGALGLAIALSACGGSSTTNDTGTTGEQATTVTLKFEQKNRCGDVSPMSSLNVLVYDEPLGVDATSTFTSYTTDPQGSIVLPKDGDSKLSFTLSTTDGYGDFAIQSYLALDMSDHQFMVLSGDSANTNDSCYCDTVNYYAEIVAGNLTGDLSRNYTYLVGMKSNGFESILANGTTLFFDMVKVCGNKFMDEPVAVQVVVDADTPSEQFIFGNKQVSSLGELNSSIMVDTVAPRITKPDLGVDYRLTHRLLVGDSYYFFDSTASDESSYASLAGFGGEKQYFYAVSDTVSYYNGNAVEGRNYRRLLQDSEDASSLAGIPQVDGLSVVRDDLNQLVGWQATQGESYAMSNFYSLYQNESTSEFVSWDIYSPNAGLIQFPALNADMLARVEQSSLYLDHIELKNHDDILDYADYLAAILSGEPIEGAVSGTYLTYYAPLAHKQQNILEQKLRMKKRDFAELK